MAYPICLWRKEYSVSSANYTKTRRACYYSYLAASSVFVLPPLLFTTFHDLLGISYTLLGTLVLVNFITQLTIDLLFSFFPKWFHIPTTMRVMPLLTSSGLFLYALSPVLFESAPYAGLLIGTVLFSLAAGLGEVLISPMIAQLPSDNPGRDMSILHSLYGWGVLMVIVVSTVFFFLFGTANWPILTIIFAILPLIASFLFFTSYIPNMPSSALGGSKNKGRTVGLMLCFLLIFFGSAAENSMTNWISSYMETALLIPKTIGDILGMAVFALLLAFCRTLYAKYGKNILRVLTMSMAAAVVCYLVAGFSRNVYVCFFACIFTGFCTSMLWPGTLILMEEKIPSVGVAAYALMAAGGDLGASVGPQLLGYLTDKVSVSDFALRLSGEISMTSEQIGLRFGIIITSLFPILGTFLLLYLFHFFKKPLNDNDPIHQM